MPVPTYFPTIDLQRTGRRIQRLRRERGLSVRELHACFGFEHPQAIYKWQWGNVCLRWTICSLWLVCWAQHDIYRLSAFLRQ